MKLLYNNVFKNYFLLMLTLFTEEIIFRFVLGFPLLDWAVLRIFVGINIISLILGALFSLFGRIIGNVLTFIIAAVFTIYAIVQAGFNNYLGVFMSFGNVSQAGAVKDFIVDYVNSFSWSFWLIAVPLIFLLLFYVFADYRVKVLERNDAIDFADKFDSAERKEQNEVLLAKKRKRRVLNGRINCIIVSILLGVFYYNSLSLGFMQNELQLKPNKELLFNPDLPNIATGQFGYTVYALSDVITSLVPVEIKEVTGYEDGYTKVEQVLNDYTRTFDDTIWEKVIASEGNANKKKLHNYFISQPITEKNDFTGFFEDKNLIVIMMESTNNMIINEEYYPNIYKLYNEGWAWTNAYSPKNSCSTGNNELSGMTSLYTINSLCNPNYYKNNVYPQSLFNLFNEKGYSTSSYHNYTEQYYYRKTYHANMGSGHYYGVEELGIPFSNQYQEWPSDIDLVKKVLEKTKDEEKFMALMTTVSAHQPYKQSSQIGDRHLDLFKDTNYNMKLKRYMSKLKEFDLAIGELLEGLEEQGKLDDTVIVLYSDHYPIGLTEEDLNSYFEYDVTVNNNIDRTPFIIYNPNVHAQKYKEYTSYVNILPTVANLFDLDYDPRLYVGNDLLSETYDNRVIFADGSWIDEKAIYNSTLGTIEYYDENKNYTSEELKEINTMVRNKIAMSNLAIKTDYFNYLNKAIDEYVIKNEETPASS